MTHVIGFQETMSNVPVWPQQCWKGCANGSNVVTLRFGDVGTKGMLGAVSFKLCATTLNNTQQHIIGCTIGRNSYVIPNIVAFVRAELGTTALD